MREIEKKKIKIERLIPHPTLGRKINDKLGIDMVESTKEGGAEQEVIVRQQGDVYEILDGHLRVEALKENGFKKVKCSVRECSDFEALMLGLKLNLMRQKMEPMHMAKTMKVARDEYYNEHPNAQRWGGNKAEQMEESFTSHASKATGISEFTIRKLLRIHDKLSEKTIAMVKSRKSHVEGKTIPVEMAGVLARVDDVEVRKKIIDTAIEKKLTTNNVSELVMEWKSGDDIDKIIDIQEWKRNYNKIKYSAGDFVNALKNNLFQSMPKIKREDIARYFDKVDREMKKARPKLDGN